MDRKKPIFRKRDNGGYGSLIISAVVLVVAVILYFHFENLRMKVTVDFGADPIDLKTQEAPKPDIDPNEKKIEWPEPDQGPLNAGAGPSIGTL